MRRNSIRTTSFRVQGFGIGLILLCTVLSRDRSREQSVRGDRQSTGDRSVQPRGEEAFEHARENRVPRGVFRLSVASLHSHPSSSQSCHPTFKDSGFSRRERRRKIDRLRPHRALLRPYTRYIILFLSLRTSEKGCVSFGTKLD